MTELLRVTSVEAPLSLYYDNNGAIAQAKELRSHSKSKHVKRQYHITREIIRSGDVALQKMVLANN